tara:strand:+ start:442 stop:978 length:537 start_codon:yes stop_codon:yes gene_type:complete
MNDYNPLTKDHSELRFIYFERIDKWDLITISAYSILTYLIFWQSDLISNIKAWGLGYTFGTHLLLYGINYKSMRKFNVWLAWFIISILHLYIFYRSGLSIEFQFINGSGISGMKFTWILLVLYQVFRYFSIRLMRVEFVALNNSGGDIWDERRTNRFDLICFLIYFPTVILINGDILI